MDAQYFQALHNEQFELFKAQNPDNDEFDVVFDIGGKRLYANKYKLCPISTTFKNMLRRATLNEPVTIQDHTFDNFKEFLTFIYSGGCELTDENIRTMVAMAEVYHVGIFKKKCEDFLLKDRLDQTNAFSLVEVAYRYTLENLKKSILDFASKNFICFIKDKRFQELPQAAVQDVADLNGNTLRQEELFEMVYKWAENQASKELNYNQNLVLDELIRNQLAPVLPFFKFKSMKFDFLLKFVVSKSFLFTGAELSDILCNARYTVILADENGKMMKGVLDCYNNDRMCDIIQSLKNVPSSTRKCYCTRNDKKCNERCNERNHWKIYRSEVPFESSKLIKSHRVDWYLVSNYYQKPEPAFLRAPYLPKSAAPSEVIGTFAGDIINCAYPVGFLADQFFHKNEKEIDYYLAVKHRNELKHDDFLLAEMVAEDGFQLDIAKFV